LYNDLQQNRKFQFSPKF